MTAREERRIMILDAAKSLFAAKGFHATRIDDIAREALIGKGTVYEYFSSKQSLLYEVIDYIISSYHQGMKEALASGENTRDRLINFAYYHTDMMERNAHMVQAMTAESGVLARELKPLLMQYQLDSLGLLGEVITLGIERGELSSHHDQDRVAVVVFGAVNQFSLQRVCYETMTAAVDRAEMAKIIDVLLQGIR